MASILHVSSPLRRGEGGRVEDGYIRGPQLIGEATKTATPRQAEDREIAEGKHNVSAPWSYLNFGSRFLLLLRLLM